MEMEKDFLLKWDKNNCIIDKLTYIYSFESDEMTFLEYFRYL